MLSRLSYSKMVENVCHFLLHDLNPQPKFGCLTPGTLRQLCSQLACVVFEDSRILREMDGGATAQGGKGGSDVPRGAKGGGGTFENQIPKTMGWC